MGDTFSYIGEGRSLLGKADTAKDLFARRYASDQAVKKQKQEKLISLDDFKINNSEMYPLFATQQAKVLQNAANDYMDIERKVGDPIKARNIWEGNKSKYQQQIYSLESANESAKKILTTKDFYYGLKPQLANAVIQNDMSGEEFAKLLHNPDQGSYATPSFSFNADFVKDQDLPKMVQDENKNPVMDINPSKARRMAIPGSNGQFMYQYPMNPDQRDAETATNKLLSDPDNIKLLVRKYGLKFSGNTDEERLASQRDAATKFVKQHQTSSFSTPVNIHPEKESAGEKKKSWSSDGNTLHNDKNAITVSNIGETDLPTLMKSNLTRAGKELGAEGLASLTKLSKNPNVKLITYSHTDAAENKPLLFVGEKGDAINGVLRGVLHDKNNPENSKIVIAETVKVPDPNNENKEISQSQWRVVPYSPSNKSVIKNEYGKNAEEALQEVGGKTGSTTNTVGQKSTKSENSFEEFEVKGKKYRIPKSDVAEFKKDMGL